MTTAVSRYARRCLVVIGVMLILAGVPATVGAYTFTKIADADLAQPESNEANNVTTLRITVK